MALARRRADPVGLRPPENLGAAHDAHDRWCPGRFCPRLLRRPRRGEARRRREVSPYRRRLAPVPRPRGVCSGASAFPVGEILPDLDGTGLALPKASPDGRVHSELPKEINMIRTIAAALAAVCFVAFGAFAQGSTTTDTGTSTKTETKSDTTKASKKHKKAKKAK